MYIALLICIVCNVLVLWRILANFSRNFSRNELLVVLMNVCSVQTSVKIVLFTGTDDYEIYLPK